MKLPTFGLVPLLIGILSFAGPAKALSAFNVYLYQDGSNVVVSGSGEVDLDGLTFIAQESHPIGINAASANLTVGTPQNRGRAPYFTYSGINGPGSFGSLGSVGGTPSPFTGDNFGVGGTSHVLNLPVGYVSGTSFSGSMTFDGTTLSGLGVTPGTYTWSWDGGANTFNLYAGEAPPSVPEPSQYGLFVFLAVLGFFGWRRLKVRAA